MKQTSILITILSFFLLTACVTKQANATVVTAVSYTHLLGYFQVNLSFYTNFSFVFIEVGRINNMTSGIDIHRCSV